MRAVPGAVLLVLVHLFLSSVFLSIVAGPAHARPDDPVGVWPLDPRPDVVRHFEPPPNPYAAGHRGVDLAGSPGQAVRAALAGTVGFAGSIGGKPVVASVERGQVVAAGDVLGRLVVTDSHCFPAACLHWGLIDGDGDARTYLDPLSLVGGGPVRLLPLWRDDPVTVRLPWSPPLATWRRPWVDSGV